jgi:IS5 family transposase
VALIQHQRYAHAKPFTRANKALRRVRTLLGRTNRDIARKIASRPELADVFARSLSLARRVKDQRQRERGRNVYAVLPLKWSASVRARCTDRSIFWVKVSVASPLNRCKGDPFVAHMEARPGNP